MAATVRHCGWSVVVVFMTTEFRDLARDVHDLAANASDLGLPVLLGLNV